eukprot:349754-Chlamydomonas_euryale.AAC.5
MLGTARQATKADSGNETCAAPRARATACLVSLHKRLPRKRAATCTLSRRCMPGRLNMSGSA